LTPVSGRSMRCRESAALKSTWTMRLWRSVKAGRPWLRWKPSPLRRALSMGRMV
jgi:hypothetical protein